MSDTKPYHHGQLKEESLAAADVHWGWVVGEFFEQEADARLTNDLEVKYWEFSQGDNSGHTETKTSVTTEWTYIIKGKLRSLVDGQEFIFAAGDYVIIQPNTPNNLVTAVLEDSCGITVKAPSNRNSKKILDRDI